MSSKDLISILYEDESLLALLKPAKIHCERRKDCDELTVASFLAETYPQVSNSTDRWEDAGLLQRLDYQTSGVILAAKSSDIRIKFKLLAREMLVNKTYLLLTQNVPDASVSCSAPIGSPYRRSKKVRVFGNKPRAKDRALEAHTDFLVLKSFLNPASALVQATCSTGRRHQVRAHSAFCGFPLLGDALYGSTGKLPDRFGELEFLLHATKIEFPHPVSQKRISIESKLPWDL